jgi:hypothetical protein
MSDLDTDMQYDRSGVLTTVVDDKKVYSVR